MTNWKVDCTLNKYYLYKQSIEPRDDNDVLRVKQNAKGKLKSWLSETSISDYQFREDELGERRRERKKHDAGMFTRATFPTR